MGNKGRGRTRVFSGPWVGGLHSADDPRFIGDDELSELVNLDVKNDGTLVPRPPFRLIESNTEYTPSNPSNYEDGITFFSSVGALRVLGKVSWSDYLDNTLILDGSTVKKYDSSNGLSAAIPYTGVTLDGSYLQVVEYNDFAYFINTTPAKCFKISSSGAVSGGAVTTIPTFPDCDNKSKALLMKDRMFVFSGNRVYYSKATDPAVWDALSGGGFFDVNPDTSNVITDFCLSNDILYIFKKDQVYAFSFDSDPATDGALQIISPDKGADHVTVFENVIYTVDPTSIYRFQNGNFTDLATKVLDQVTFKGPPFVFQNKLHVFDGNNRFLVYNTVTGAWTTYTVPVWISSTMDVLTTAVYDVTNNGYGYVLLGGAASALYLLGGDPSQVLDSMPHIDGTTKYTLPDYILTTKSFTFDDQFSWKRLFKAHLMSPVQRGLVRLTPYFISAYDYHTSDGVTIDELRGYYVIDKVNTARLKQLNGSVRFRDLMLSYRSTDRQTDVNGNLKNYYYNFRAADDSGGDEIPSFSQIALDVSLNAEADR